MNVEYVRSSSGEIEHDRSSDYGFDAVLHCRPDCVDDTAVANVDSGDHFEDFTADDFGMSAYAQLVVDLDCADDLEVAHHFSEKSFVTALRDISIPRKTAQRRIGEITPDDFEHGIPRHAFKMVHWHARNYMNPKTPQEVFLKSVEFLFCFNDPTDECINFDLCCRVLEARPDIIRLRLQYQLWRDWRVFPYCYQFITTPLPIFMQEEIQFLCGYRGVEIAQEAWIHPGITTSYMIAFAAGFQEITEMPNDLRELYFSSLMLLESRYILSPRGDNWYMTGRNPSLFLDHRAEERNLKFIRGSTSSWSKLF